MNLRMYSARELETMPTLSVGQAHDLKLETTASGVSTRYWLSRCDRADGETHAVHVEQFDGGRWVDVDRYEPL